MTTEFSRKAIAPRFLERTLPITYRSLLAAEGRRPHTGAIKSDNAHAFIDMVFEHYAATETCP
jgi:hypothetical protein